MKKYDKYKSRDWLYHHYKERGMSCRAIANICECATTTVWKWLIACGIPRLNPGGRRHEFLGAGLKRCSICEKILPIALFHKNRRQYDGLSLYCKQCNCVKAATWRQKNRERSNELVYLSSKRHPQHANARSLANYTYPIAQPCSCDGCNATGERHHPDYSKPKEITWLCPQHHDLLEAGLRQQ